MKRNTIFAIAVYPLLVFLAIFVGAATSQCFPQSLMGKVIIVGSFVIAPIISGLIDTDKPVRNAVLGAVAFLLLFALLTAITLTKVPSSVTATFFLVIIFPVYAFTAAVFGYLGGKLRKRK